MEVKLLEATIYDDAGWTWWTEQTRDPTWNDIAVTLRRLDRFCYPFV
jgi:hypothetical protein